MATGDMLKLRRWGLDSAGNRIIWIYARKIPEYLVYHDNSRVSVHFADREDQENIQRRVFATLSPLRGQISGLIDGWRRGGTTCSCGSDADYEDEGDRARNLPEPEAQPETPGVLARVGAALGRPFAWWREKRIERDCARATLYDRRVADAVIMALEGSESDALALLTEIREDIVTERKSAAKSDYLITAGLTGIVFILVISALSSNALQMFPNAPEKVHLIWTGSAAGVLGAFFSVATGLHSRTLLVDLQKWTNRGDAFLRMVIGTMGSGILICFMLAEVVNVAQFSDKLIAGGDAAESSRVLMSLVIGFVAGFSERAVGDLLGKFGLTITQDDSRPDVATDKAKAAAAVAAQTSLTPAPAPDAEAVLVAVDPVMDALDESPCDSPPVEGEIPTSDEDLPVAVGGVSADVPAPAVPAEPPQQP